MRQFYVALLGGALALGTAASAWSQTSLSGSSLVYSSLGSTSLSQSGYVGTFLTVPTGGSTINFDVNATGSAGHMNVVIANSSFGFNVMGASPSDYDTQNVICRLVLILSVWNAITTTALNNTFSVNNLSVNTVSGGTATFANDAMGTHRRAQPTQ